jgi:hypothetical protein
MFYKMRTCTFFNFLAIPTFQAALNNIAQWKPSQAKVDLQDLAKSIIERTH